MKRLSIIWIAILLATLALPGAALADSKQKSAMHDWNTGAPIAGAKAQLEREDDSVEIEIKTKVTGGDAYTIWWIVFNNPAACAGGVGGCGAVDLHATGVQASVLWATGKVANANGKLKIEAELHEGQIPGQLLFGPGLLDAQGAEIHALVRSHGPASSDPAILHAQLTSVGGGCDINVCADEQGVGFPPGGGQDDD